MPAAMAAAVTWAAGALGVGITAATAATIGTALWYVAVVAVAYSQQQRAKRKARAAYNSSLQDRLVMLATTDGMRSRVYGRVRQCDGILFKATHGPRKELYTIVVALAGHEIDAIEGYYLDDSLLELDGNGDARNEPWAKGGRDSRREVIPAAAGSFTLADVPLVGSITILDGLGEGGESGATSETPPASVNGRVITFGAAASGRQRIVRYQTSTSDSKVKVRGFLGTAGQNVGAYLTSIGVPGVTANDKFSGIACAAMTLQFDTDTFPTGVPQLTAVFRGAKVFDPRNGQTVWTDNPALQARDWALYPWGGNMDPADVNSTAFAVAANACDVPHAFKKKGSSSTTTRPMFTSGMVAKMGDDPSGVMDELVEAMGGRWGFSGGVLTCRAGVYRPPVAEIDESWLSGTEAINIVPEPPADEAINIVRPTICDAAQDYVAVPIPEVRADNYVILDGREMPREEQYDAVSDIDHAQHVAGIKMREARSGLTVQLPCNLRALGLELFDTVWVTLPRYGWDAKTFEVLDWRFSVGLGIVLTLKETAPSIFDPDADFSLVDATPNSNLPSYRLVPTPGPLQVVSGVASLADGSVVTRVQVSWPALNIEAVDKVEVQYALATTDSAPEQWQSAPLEAGASTSTTIVGLRSKFVYLFRARAINSLGVRSPWSTQKAHTVAAPAITLLKNLRLIASSQIFAVSKAGATSPAAITLQAQAQNLGGVAAWSVLSGTATLTGSGSSRTLTAANMSTDIATIQVAQDGLFDQVTIVRLREGADAFLMVLSNEAHVIPAAADGTPVSLAGAATTVAIYRGTAVDTANWVLTHEAVGVTVTRTGSTWTVTAMAADIGYVEITATRSGFAALTKRFVLTKARAGERGTDGAGSFNWVPDGSVVVESGNGLRKASSTASWTNASAYSVESFVNGAYVSFQSSQVNGAFMVGLNSDPITDRSYTSIDYAWYPQANGTAEIYVSGGRVSAENAYPYTTQSVFSIAYDGRDVRWLIDGAVVRTQTVGAGLRLFVDSSLNSAQVRVSNVAFGPVGQRGADGDSAPVLTLYSSLQAFKFNGAGAPTPAAQTATLQVVLANMAGTATWTGTRYNGSGSSLGAATLGGSGNARTLTVAAFGDAAYVVVRAELGGKSDQVTLPRLVDGRASVVGLLSNEAALVQASASGVVASFAAAGGVFRVWQGTDDVTGDGPVYSRVSQTGVSLAINATTGAYSVSAMSANQGSAVLRAVYAGVTIDKVYTIAKSIAGEDGVKSWRTTNDPGSAAKEGDLWFVGNRVYVRVNGAWVFQRVIGDGDVDTPQIQPGAVWSGIGGTGTGTSGDIISLPVLTGGHALYVVADIAMTLDLGETESGPNPVSATARLRLNGSDIATQVFNMRGNNGRTLARFRPSSGTTAQTITVNVAGAAIQSARADLAIWVMKR